MKLSHGIAPVFNEDSRILILGSFPSVKSRESEFFYGHPQNRFWKLLSNIFADTLPKSNEEKKAFLLKHRIALWDVIESCEIEGSSDSSIKDVKANNLKLILIKAKIQSIYLNGKTAEKLYNRYILPQTGIKAISLPSTSPANAAWSLERLTEKWIVIKDGENQYAI